MKFRRKLQDSRTENREGNDLTRRCKDAKIVTGTIYFLSVVALPVLAVIPDVADCQARRTVVRARTSCRASADRLLLGWGVRRARAQEGRLKRGEARAFKIVYNPGRLVRLGDGAPHREANDPRGSAGASPSLNYERPFSAGTAGRVGRDCGRAGGPGAVRRAAGGLHQAGGGVRWQ